MDSPETQVDFPELPEEIRQRLRRMEGRSPWEMGLAALFFAALAALVFSAAAGRGDLRARLDVSGPFVFGGLALAALAGRLALDRGRRARTAEFQALAGLLYRRASTDLAMRDPVTGAYDRAGLGEFFRSYSKLATRRQKPLALMLVRMEYLAEMKHSYGQAVTDVALAELARALRRETRGSDIVARFGIGEFALLLADSGIAGAEGALLRVQQRLRAEGLRVRDEQVPVELAFGAAVCQDGMDLDALAREAEMALLKRKATGAKVARAAASA